VVTRASSFGRGNRIIVAMSHHRGHGHRRVHGEGYSPGPGVQGGRTDPEGFILLAEILPGVAMVGWRSCMMPLNRALKHLAVILRLLSNLPIAPGVSTSSSRSPPRLEDAARWRRTRLPVLRKVVIPRRRPRPC